MSFYQVNSRELRNSGDQLMNLVEKFKVQKEELSSIEQALGSMWEGEAKESFHSAFLRDCGQMEAFAEVVTGYFQVMESIADRYDVAESRNLSIANNRTY